MTMKSTRRLAAGLAFFTILCGAVLKVFPTMPAAFAVILSVLAIVLAIATVYVVVKFHRCPRCGKFIPITARPKECIYCDSPLP